jgi:potassium efflux system protein
MGKVAKGQSSTLAALLTACLALAPSAMSSARAQPSGGEAEVSVEAIEAALEGLEELPELDAAAKAQAKESLAAAKASLESARKATADAASFARKLEEAAAEREAQPNKPSGAIAQTQAPSPEEIAGWPKRDLAELEQLLAAHEPNLAAARQKLAALQDEGRRRAERSVECNKLEAEARKQLESLAALAAPAADAGPVAAAARLAQSARRLELESLLEARAKELHYYKQTNDLLPAWREQAEAQASQLEKAVKALQDAVNAKRRTEAQQSADRAAWEKQEAVEKHPAVRALAEANEALARRLPEWALRLERASNDRKSWEERRKTLVRDFEEVQRLVEKSGLTEAVGFQLRKRHAALPDARRQRAEQLARQAELSTAQLEYFDLTDQRERLAGVDDRWPQILADLARDGKLAASPPDPSDRESVQSVVGLLKQRRTHLDALRQHCVQYIETLGTIEHEDRLHAETAHDYARYIDGRVLWIRSAEPVAAATFRRAWQAWQSHWRDGQWLGVVRTLSRDLLEHPAIDLGLAVLFVPYFLAQRRLRRNLTHVGEQAIKSTTCRFWFTARALYLTLAISLFWPAVLWTLGWRLGAPLEAVPSGEADSTLLAKALASGLQAVAVVYLACDLLRHLCRGRGLAEAHFGWPQSTLRTVRGNVRWLMVAALPLALVVWTMENHPSDPQRNSLGRLAFIVWLLATAVFLKRVLRQEGGALSELIAYNRGGWLDRLSFVWRPLAIGAPLALALLAGVGYYYTSMQLVGRLQATAWLLLGTLVAWAVVLRWLLLARRQLAINQARQRREAAQFQTDETPGLPPAADAASELNLSAINSQTRQLIASFAVLAVMLGVWFIWVDVLPALGLLDRFVVWGEQAVEGHVTLSDAFVVLLIAVMTTIAAKNIPGLLEIALLQRLPLDSGLRYAVSAVSKYLISIVGITAACAQMGIRWEKVQWLVAAISVGLGFGLQEIFANFISGLIILFERPVRPGDVVTVGDVTGCVTQIRIRATTITDWDRKELLVPNKELISGRVMNWTLSDRVVRITLRIGVAYGSDIARTTQILVQIVNEQAGVLQEPPPSVTFEAFGESTLDFVVRAFLVSLDETLKVKHQLNTRIEAELRAAGIEIAYPQQDIHVRSLPEAMSLRFERRSEEERQRKRAS